MWFENNAEQRNIQLNAMWFELNKTRKNNVILKIPPVLMDNFL